MTQQSPPPPPPAEGAADDEDLQLSIIGLRTVPDAGEPGEMAVELNTTRGVIETRLHPCEGKTGCAIFVGGAMGGLDGPADRVYQRLGRDLVARGITSVRVQWRKPGEFEECVMDALAACSFMKGIGAENAVIIGHSFGGAVAIKAGQLGDLVGAVAAMSSQRHGTQDVDALGKPLLLVHGSDDDILDKAASEDIHERAKDPKQLVILEGAGHGLLEAADEVYERLTNFIVEHVGDAESE
jgi:alpha-beta hydrolase superfamily lysophospholipase